MSSVGGKTYVKSKETRFENGKLTIEEFEGTTEPQIYDNVMGEIRRYFVDQTAFFLKQFSSLFIPFSRNKSDRDD